MPLIARVLFGGFCAAMAVVSIIAMLVAPSRDAANWSLSAAIWCAGIALCGRGE